MLSEGVFIWASGVCLAAECIHCCCHSDNPVTVHIIEESEIAASSVVPMWPSENTETMLRENVRR